MMCAALVWGQCGHKIYLFKFLQFPPKQSNQAMWKLQLEVENYFSTIIEKDKKKHCWNDTNLY